MCELLIWIQDSPSTGDPAMDSKRDKAGNVITVQNDGWKWTTLEKNNSAWRIVSIPGLSASDPAVLILFRSEQTQRLMDNPLDPMANPVTNLLLRTKVYAVTVLLLQLTPVGSVSTWTKNALINATSRLPAILGSIL